MKYIDTWDLDSIFPGGTQSKELQNKLKAIEQQIVDYESTLTSWVYNGDRASIETLKQLLNIQEDIEKGIRQAGTFVRMSLDAFMDDEYGSVVFGKVMDLSSEMRKLGNIYTKKLVEINEDDWQELLKDQDLRQVDFALNEIRKQGSRLLSEAEEVLIAELDKDGLAAWSELYDTTVSIMTIPLTNEDGETTELSVGQAMNRMYADPDPKVRQKIFENWEAEWEKYAPIFAHNLNHLAGYRLTLQAAHGRDHHLDEPLEYNRMSQQTLDAMWSAVENNKQPFTDYLTQKAKVFGMDKLGWQDVDAPVTVGDAEPTLFSYDEACDFIIEHFKSFGGKLTEFTKHALKNRWVEAEDRPNKRPGGYCANLPEFEESRIFMTFTGSPSDVSTLAHELGHAFHSHVMKDLPQLNRRYSMNVAETASTFAETIIDNAAINSATSDEGKISLLASKLEISTAMFLNIHARFLFEDAFYTERKEGIVPTSRLNELMENAQKEAYDHSLSTYHPHFWCSKLHFFIDRVPFYNFPYTFGYLFSLGIYAQYLKQPEGFEEKYIELLRDTGSMKVEDLAKKHLDVDLTQEYFWASGIQLMAKDVDEFIRLTDNYLK